MLKKFLLGADQKTLTTFRMTIADALTKDLATCLDEYAYEKMPDVESDEYFHLELKLDDYNNRYINAC